MIEEAETELVPGTGGQVYRLKDPNQPLPSSITGSLDQVGCDATRARLRLSAGGKTVRLLIADPDAITITNQPGSSVSLSCGDQNPPKRVNIQYIDKPDSGGNSVGEVRAIEFLN